MIGSEATVNRAQLIIGRLALVSLAVLVALLAIEAKRCQYPDSASNNPYLASAIKMSEARGSRCAEAFIIAAIRISPVLVPVARAVVAPDPVPPTISQAGRRLQIRPPPQSA